MLLLMFMEQPEKSIQNSHEMPHPWTLTPSVLKPFGAPSGTLPERLSLTYIVSHPREEQPLHVPFLTPGNFFPCVPFCVVNQFRTSEIEMWEAMWLHCPESLWGGLFEEENTL